MSSLLFGDLKNDFEKYIREQGRASQELKPKPRLSLEERDSMFFAKYVQELRFVELTAIDSIDLSNCNRRQLYDYLKFYKTYPHIVQIVSAQFKTLLPEGFSLNSVKVPTASA